MPEWHCGGQDQRRGGSMEGAPKIVKFDSKIISFLGDFGRSLG